LTATVEQSQAARAELLAAAPPAVVVEHVCKTFRLPHRRYNTFKERALHPFSTRTFDELEAVRDVSVTIAQGEFFGIVGRNGSGKSTLLKCLAGIYTTDRGHAVVQGRLSPFIELGVGFNPELTARENVIINAIMLGLTRRQARDRFDDIVAFAELEQFLDLKLKNYSSGMNVRLAFSTAIQVDADVLIVDEVLAVGDAAFQQKCLDTFHRLKAEGKTIVFVTHDMSAVERFCDRAMLLERGEIVDIGEPRRIARAYNELNFGRLPQTAEDAEADGGGARAGDQGAAEIVDSWFEDRAGERVTSIAQGEPLALCTEVRFHDAMEAPLFALHLRNAVRHTIFGTSSDTLRLHTGAWRAGERVIVRVKLENWLAPGRYTLTPTVARPDRTADVLDLREDLAHIVVHGTRSGGGVVDVPHSFDLERL
jgi:ABC-type polysaccharide/polyol phosphate transport system ATPase subunit